MTHVQIILSSFSADVNRMGKAFHLDRQAKKSANRQFTEAVLQMDRQNAGEKQ